MFLTNGTLLQGGKYRIIRHIGSGGFGCTYEAEHTMLCHRVAIKEFFVKDFCNRDASTGRVTIATDNKKERIKKLHSKFIDEAKAIFSMNHPGIVRVTDIFEENETAYYVMEYIDGCSLGEVLEKRGVFTEEEATRIIRAAAEALAHVHSTNRLHLDIKPGNIMLGNNGKVTLIDFGVSKQYDEVNGENTSTLLGKTPGFAPPEQMGNNIKAFTPATDIYALGATFYKMLTGITPPDSSSRACDDELIPLPDTFSHHVQNAVDAALQLSRSKRPQSIADFLALLSTEAVTAEVQPADGDTIIEHHADDNTELYDASLPDLIPIVDKNNEKYGFIDKNGKEVIPCKYGYAGGFSEGLALVQMNDKWGFVDKNGKEVIPCKYDDAWDLSEGLAQVKKNGKWGFIDKNGKEVIPCKYDYAYAFYEGLAAVIMNGKYVFIDKNGKEVIPCKYDYAGGFSEGLAKVKMNDKRGFIDKNGNEVIPCRYDDAGDFSEGLAKVEMNGKWGFLKKNRKWGFIDKNGNEVIPCKYDIARDFSEGLAIVKMNGKWGFIDKYGNEVIPCKYDDAGGFSEGLAPVKKNDKWGFIDKYGNEVIPCEYGSAYTFSEGLAQVKMNDKYGFIDKYGNEVIPCEYDLAFTFTFSKGLALVEKNDCSFYIDKNISKNNG